MICPRCSIGDIPDVGSQCTVCGFQAGTNVVLDEPPVDAVLEAVRKGLGSRFDVQALLKVGERSFVYLAREFGQDRLVALKVIPIPGGVDSILAQRFAQQADLVMRVTHAHVVPLYDYGSSRSFVWYTMPYVPDATLAELLRRSGPLDAEPCAVLLQQVANALDHAHRQGMVHANLKPTNVFVTPENWARLSDFAPLEPFRRTGTVYVMPARPEYLAPEQFRGRGVGPSADQYGLAVLAFECLTGGLPFVGDSLEEIARLHATEPPPLATAVRPEVPPAMAGVIQRGMGKTPVARFPTVLDFATALTQAAAPRSPRTPRNSPVPQALPTRVLLVDAPAPPHRNWPVLAGAAVLVVAAAIWLWNAGGSGRLFESEAGWISPAGTPSRQDLPPAPAAPTQEPPGAASPPSTPPAARAGAGAPAAAPDSTVGHLFVNSIPWGELYIDGVLIGLTPKAALTVPAGRHQIRVAREGFVAFEREVQLEAGRTVRLTDIVLSPQRQEPVKR
jgi:serine/threonine protein kinase